MNVRVDDKEDRGEGMSWCCDATVKWDRIAARLAGISEGRESPVDATATGSAGADADTEVDPEESESEEASSADPVEDATVEDKRSASVRLAAKRTAPGAAPPHWRRRRCGESTEIRLGRSRVESAIERMPPDSLVSAILGARAPVGDDDARERSSDMRKSRSACVVSSTMLVLLEAFDFTIRAAVACGGCGGGLVRRILNHDLVWKKGSNVAI